MKIHGISWLKSWFLYESKCVVIVWLLDVLMLSNQINFWSRKYIQSWPKSVSCGSKAAVKLFCRYYIFHKDTNNSKYALQGVPKFKRVFMIAINALLTLIVFGVNCTCNVQKRKTGLWGFIEFGLHVYEWILGL